MNPLDLAFGFVNRARLRISLLLMYAGAALADVKWPAAAVEDDPEQDFPTVGGAVVTLTPEALKMIEDGRQQSRRVKPAQPRPLKGSAQERLQNAEAARRKAGG
jgi:hypothetical protein